MELKVFREVPSACLPSRADDDSQLDLAAIEDIVIPAGQTVKINTGICLGLPRNVFVLIVCRSSLALKGLSCPGGTVDTGYRGPLHVILRNSNETDYVVRAQNKIGQMLILQSSLNVRLTEVNSKEELGKQTSRDQKAFGSSGQ